MRDADAELEWPKFGDFLGMFFIDPLGPGQFLQAWAVRILAPTICQAIKREFALPNSIINVGRQAFGLPIVNCADETAKEQKDGFRLYADTGDCGAEMRRAV